MHLYSTARIFILTHYATVVELEHYSAQLFIFLPLSLWQQDGKADQRPGSTSRTVPFICGTHMRTWEVTQRQGTYTLLSRKSTFALARVMG